jgi:hypothetical protein
MDQEEYEFSPQTVSGEGLLTSIKSLQEQLLNLDILKTKKKSVRKEDLPASTRTKLSRLSKQSRAHVSGVGNRKNLEASPIYIRADGEKVIKGDSDASIVLGRDRPTTRGSGYGGQGHTQAASFRLVAGRQGSNANFLGPDGTPMYADPDFDTDAITILGSQKTNVDENLKLQDTNSPLDPPSRGESALALKADTLRLVSRGSTRITTMAGGSKSTGGPNDVNSGISLVANNDTTNLQPMVKGTNLINAMRDLVDMVDDLRSTLANLVDHQMLFNTRLMNHTHLAPFFGLPTSPSKELLMEVPQFNQFLIDTTVMSLKNTGLNMALYEKDYLEQWGSPNNKKYILSKFNKVN